MGNSLRWQIVYKENDHAVATGYPHVSEKRIDPPGPAGRRQYVPAVSLFSGEPEDRIQMAGPVSPGRGGGAQGTEPAPPEESPGHPAAFGGGGAPGPGGAPRLGRRPPMSCGRWISRAILPWTRGAVIP